MIESLLPPRVVAVSSFVDRLDATLFPEEELVVSRAVDKRRLEFTTARWCARNALARLGVGPVPILPGERGAPQWPAGIVGSMTHCLGYRGAAVGWGRDVASIGIDAEPNEPLPDGVVTAVTGASERSRLGNWLRARPDVHWGRLIFSAKESVYKAWYPLTGRWLDFHEADIIADPVTGVFRANLLVPGFSLEGRMVTAFEGRWKVERGLIVTTVTIPSVVSGLER